MNAANLHRFGRWFPEMCREIVGAGSPQPRIHASWMFAYREEMTSALAGAGVIVDCSVCYGGAHYLKGGALLADSRRRPHGRPYRLDGRDHCKEGTGPIVELPVSGGFGSYWEPDGKGGFAYFVPVGSDGEMARQLRLFSERLVRLHPGEVDIFQVHFHLYEFLEPSGMSLARMYRASALLRSMAADNRTKFSTPASAAADWLSSIHRARG